MSAQNDINQHSQLRALEAVRERAWVWDTQLAMIVWANTAGMTFWSEHDLSRLKKRSFDRAMPAIATLQSMAESQLPEQGVTETFLFWTAQGPRSVECKCTDFISEDGFSGILLQELAEEEEISDVITTPANWNVEPIDTVRELDTTFSNTLSEPEDQETLKEIARLLSDPEEEEQGESAEEPVVIQLSLEENKTGASLNGVPLNGVMNGNGLDHPPANLPAEHHTYTNGAAVNHFQTELEQPDASTDINESEKEAEEAEETEIHLAKVGHEIRTPLNSIIGFAELMHQEKFGEIGNVKYKGYVENILESAQHALSLVNDLLELSKVQNGEPALNPSPIDLNSTVEHCISSLQPQTGQARLVIRQSLSKNIPSITADHRSLRQIILNLMSNAIKFTAAGGQIIVSTQKVGDEQVKLRVRDTGIGMSEDDLQTALLPFGQVETAIGEASGTGLGLPLTKALTEANKGVFNISSTEGRGTMVEILFPTWA